jgi:hypothetical protein
MAWHRGTPPPEPLLPPPASQAGDKCDRCDWPGQVRLRKTVSHLCDSHDEPHVFGKIAELVLCSSHYRTHEAALRLDGWRETSTTGGQQR